MDSNRERKLEKDLSLKRLYRNSEEPYELHNTVQDTLNAIQQLPSQTRVLDAQEVGQPNSEDWIPVSLVWYLLQWRPDLETSWKSIQNKMQDRLGFLFINSNLRWAQRHAECLYDLRTSKTVR